MDKQRILLADDDRLIVATLGEGLRQAGYEVLEAASGEEALQICESTEPDLAILDVRMPGISGIDVGRHLYNTSHTPFMFLSAYGDNEVVKQAADEGALGYLVKPVDVQQILPSIEAALARARDISHLKATESRLHTALASGRETSVAVGLLMERYHLTEDEAFASLRRHARSQRRKIAEVATELVKASDTLNQVRTDIEVETGKGR